MKHTKGPWRIDKSADNALPCVVGIDPKDRQEFEICEVWGEDIDIKETPMARANAHLIAAAPELLEACKALYNAKGNQSRLEKALIKAEAAIAKAEEKP